MPPLEAYRGHPGPAVQEAPAIRRILVGVERGNPVGSGRKASKPDDLRKEGSIPSGHRKTQEANAASRKARGIHNPADTDPCDPDRKAADVGLVSHPKYGVKAVNRGES
jgi:hypothetical protein